MVEDDLVYSSELNLKTNHFVLPTSFITDNAIYSLNSVRLNTEHLKTIARLSRRNVNAPEVITSISLTALS